ncbi:MAG: aspartate/glutamate racemase family protein [Candidatus Bipolaricaulota bacterium]|nr:aspartate/glutamate racemase family protein [Candidatus Bipolaricaulota bacterium]
MNIGLIRVLTVENMEAIDAHGVLIENAFPGLRVKSQCIKDQPYGIYDKESEEVAKPKIIKLAKELEGKVEAIIVSCAADPGVKELKNELHIPIVGAGEGLAAVARTLGSSVGVITITDDVPDPVRKGLGEHHLTWAKIEGVETTLDLKENDIVAHTLNAARALKRQGSNVIALACTGFSTINVAPEIGETLGIPVVDPVLATGSIAYNLMLNKKGRKNAKD